MIISGDIVLDDASVEYPEANLTLVETPEDIDAGIAPLIPILVAAAVGVTLAVADTYTEEKAYTKLRTSIIADFSKYDDPEKQKHRLAELLVENNMKPGLSIEDVMQELSDYESNYVAAMATGAAISGVAALGDPLTAAGLTALTISDTIGNTISWIASNNAINDLSTTYAVKDYLHNSTSLDLNTIQSLSELVKGGEFSTSSDLVYWTEKSNAEAGYSSFGSISYPGASSDQLFGFVHTGLGATSDQGSMLQTVLPIKNSSAVFTARYNFVTTEFPQFLGSQFNDSFVIKIEDIESGATKVLASFSGSLNTLFDPNDPVVQNLPAEFLDMVASGGGQTDWVTESSDQIALKSGGKYRIYIDVKDVGDKIYDSALLIDKVSLR